MKKTLFIFFILAILNSSLFCQKASDSKDTEKKAKITFVDETGIYRLSPLTDSVLLGTGAALFGTNIFLDKAIGFNHVDYSTYNFDKTTIPTLDAILMQDFSKSLNYLSYGTLALSAITPAIFVTEPESQWLTIGVMYLETMLWAHNLKETAKNLVIRPRPYMYYDLSNAPQDKLEDYDWENSFFSGHTTLAFAAASFTSYLFCQFNSDSKWKYAVIGGSYALAATTGVLRIASGNHFFSDVVCGAITGTLTGFFVPYFHTSPFWKSSKKLNVSVIPNGVMLTARL